MRIRITLGVAALALALAGCAGGGSSTSTASSAPVSATTTGATSPTRVAGPSSTGAGPSSTPASKGGTSFTAFGGTTHWRAVVDNGVMTTEGTGVGERRVSVVGTAWANGVEFTGTDQGRSISLLIRAGHCQDVHGKDTGQVAELIVGNRKLRGCAVSGAVPHGGNI